MDVDSQQLEEVVQYLLVWSVCTLQLSTLHGLIFPIRAGGRSRNSVSPALMLDLLRLFERMDMNESPQEGDPEAL